VLSLAVISRRAHRHARGDIALRGRFFCQASALLPADWPWPHGLLMTCVIDETKRKHVISPAMPAKATKPTAVFLQELANGRPEPTPLELTVNRAVLQSSDSYTDYEWPWPTSSAKRATPRVASHPENPAKYVGVDRPHR